MNTLFRISSSILIFTLCVAANLGAQQTASPIQISLATESTLQPLALIWKILAPGALDSKRLEEVLRFDINHDGYMQCLKIDSQKMDANLTGEVNDSWDKLKEYGTRYVLQVTQGADSIRADLFDVQARRSTQSPQLDLTGSLDRDRRQMHRLHDWMIQLISNHRGIAGSTLLYTVDVARSSHKKSSTQIWQSDYDGANAKLILQQEALLVTPCYLPHKNHNPTYFAFVSYRLGQPKILFSSMNGEFKRVTALGGSQLSPAIDASGSQLAFVCDVEGNPDIYRMKLDVTTQKGERATKLFGSKRGTQASPCFSPDGKRLALVSSKDGEPRIYIIDIDEHLKGYDCDRARLISRKNRENTCPAWSPDGRYLAYSARNSSTRQIWIYDTQTQSEQCLTEGEGTKENPSWADDSLHLFYNQESGHECQIHMIDLNTRLPTRITHQRSAARFPCASRS